MNFLHGGNPFKASLNRFAQVQAQFDS